MKKISPILLHGCIAGAALQTPSSSLRNFNESCKIKNIQSQNNSEFVRNDFVINFTQSRRVLISTRFR